MTSSDDVIKKQYYLVDAAINETEKSLVNLLQNNVKRQSNSPNAVSDATLHTEQWPPSTPPSRPSSSSRVIRNRAARLTSALTQRNTLDTALKLRIVESTRLVEKQEKLMLFKQVISLSGPFGKLMKDAQEIPTLFSSVCCGASICRTGTNAMIITSHTETPHSLSKEIDQRWCFGSQKGLPIPELSLPLIPIVIKNGQIMPIVTIGTPFTVTVFQKISPGDRTTITEVTEIRSQTTNGSFHTEIFSDPCDRKTEKLAYEERIFLGDGVIRVITKSTACAKKMDVTSVTRHMWKSDLAQNNPVMTTAKDNSYQSPGFSLCGSLSDTSAGSPGSASPSTRNLTMEVFTNAVQPAVTTLSHHQLIPSSPVANGYRKTWADVADESVIAVTNTQNFQTDVKKNEKEVEGVNNVVEAVKLDRRNISHNKSEDISKTKKNTSSFSNPFGILSSVANSFFPWISSTTEPSTRITSERIGLHSILPVVGPSHKSVPQKETTVPVALPIRTLEPTDDKEKQTSDLVKSAERESNKGSPLAKWTCANTTAGSTSVSHAFAQSMTRTVAPCVSTVPPSVSSAAQPSNTIPSNHSGEAIQNMQLSIPENVTIKNAASGARVEVRAQEQADRTLGKKAMGSLEDTIH